MAITNFIPTVWSETLYEELQKNYVGVNLCSREYEGEIKNQGDRVKINGIGPVSVFDYKKNEDMPDPQVLSDNSRTLIIDQAKAFNFYIDDIDDIQSSPKLMQTAMKNASKALSDVADKYVYEVAESGTSMGFTPINKTNVHDFLSSIRCMLLENNVPDSEPLSLEISPAVEQVLVMANILSDTNNSNTLARGYVGKILGFDIYVTNNIKGQGFSADPFLCLARTKRAITFAEQINSIKTYEPEHRHGIAVKGLHLYGAKVVYPNEMILAEAVIG